MSSSAPGTAPPPNAGSVGGGGKGEGEGGGGALGVTPCDVLMSQEHFCSGLIGASWQWHVGNRSNPAPDSTRC